MNNHLLVYKSEYSFKLIYEYEFIRRLMKWWILLAADQLGVERSQYNNNNNNYKDVV